MPQKKLEQFSALQRGKSVKINLSEGQCRILSWRQEKLGLGPRQ